MRIIGLVTQEFDRGYHHGMNHPWLWLMILATGAVVVAVVIWAVLRAAGPAGHPASYALRPDPAMDALRMRFAQGEIDAAEYAARAAQLAGHAPPPPQPPHAAAAPPAS